MNIIKDDIWNYHKEGNFVVITTNGFVKKTGQCVMGRGIALQAKNKFRGFDKKLGQAIKEQGNKLFIWKEERIITFPVKHVWWEKADLRLIEQSAIQLKYICKQPRMDLNLSQNCIYMPKAGCSNGKLEWKDVEPIISKHLPDITIVDLI